MGKKWIKSNILDIIQVAALVGAGVIGIIVWLQRVPQYLVALGILFTVVLILTGVNQYAVWKERHKKGFSTLSNDNMAAELRKWFDKRHYSSCIVPDDKTFFLVVGTDPQSRPLNVFKPKENQSVICIRLGINEEQIAQVLPQPYQNLARFNISIEMARIGLLCHATPPMHIDQELQCDEFLTESTFWNAIDKIRQGHVLIRAHLNLAALEAKKEKRNPSITEQVPDKKDSQP